MRKKTLLRRRLGQLRAEFHSVPWSLDVRAYGALAQSLAIGDLDTVKATLVIGQESEESIARNVNGVAVIPVTGVLCDEMSWMVRWGMASSYQQLEKEFVQQIGSDQIKAVAFYFDTPGGSAIGCKRLADIIFAARGSKPIVAYTQKLCCSAGYYMAAACDRIEATADALVASVGTIYTHIEMSGFLKEIGYSAEVITNSGSPKKGHGNMYQPLSDEARQTLQSYVESYGQPFIADVARYRGISPADVLKSYGQGDSIRADMAAKGGVIDAIVGSVDETIKSLTNPAGSSSATSQITVPAVPGNSTVVLAVVAGAPPTTRSSAMNERIKAQLFALGLIDSLDASDTVCKAALNAFFAGSGKSVPGNDVAILSMLQTPLKASDETETEPEDEQEEDDDTECTEDRSPRTGSKRRKAAPVNEQEEARLEDLQAAADLVNETVGYKAITAEMVLEAATKRLNPRKAMSAWKESLADNESPIPTDRVSVKGEGADQYAKDVVDALVYRAGNEIKLSDNALALTSQPISAVAHKCLTMAGYKVDAYGNREQIAEMAMAMASPGFRHTFYSPRENRKYIQAAATPAARPGDFPNILSAFANKYLDTIELDDDYSYPEVSAVLPGGLNDFKPGLLINKGIVEELDEVQDAEQIKELGVSEEVLSYIFMRRFANKLGWTPVMIANDDLNAFAEGMLGLDEAWQVTQNRLVVDLYTSNPTLLDGSALFADRTNTGSGTNPALNNNDVTSGSTPSDAQWGAMEAQYADIGGIGTGRRVRGTLNTWFGPTGTPYVEARRTFLPLGTMGLEDKTANTTSNVGLYRGLVKLVPESELRPSSLLKWYGLRSPTRLNTATVVRGYFNGFGEAGRRERWYDPETKTTWVSIEGRIATAVKNWRYVVRNAGA